MPFWVTVNKECQNALLFYKEHTVAMTQYRNYSEVTHIEVMKQDDNLKSFLVRHNEHVLTVVEPFSRQLNLPMALFTSSHQK